MVLQGAALHDWALTLQCWEVVADDGSVVFDVSGAHFLIGLVIERYSGNI